MFLFVRNNISKLTNPIRRLNNSKLIGKQYISFSGWVKKIRKHGKLTFVELESNSSFGKNLIFKDNNRFS
ncbi:hypothetical protein A3Q56_08386 [Intoshia linei]|uniref:OB domain-containing protein n=1 Tax=Intoshia linei TaxID=1819745 RepID=A0A177AQ42_9BILA|nr:hypothetical protein A3Q56_08386 [Intoshia linei]